jgi:hypothetical protein
MQNTAKQTRAEKAAAKKAAAAAAQAAADAKNLPAVQAPAPVETDATPAKLTHAERGLARDAAGIKRGATNFGAYTGRDDAYTAFFGAICRSTGSDTIDLQTILRYARGPKNASNPYYAGSCKATDVGAINRQCSDGRFTKSRDGSSITATDHGKSLKAFNAETLAPRPKA